MKTSRMFSIGLSALVLTGAAAGIAMPGVMAVAASAENPKRAASYAAKASKMIAKRNADKAVRYAEEAVGYAPQVAEYRALLGQAYLLSGRFVSARQAFNDALTLDPANGRAALNLALTEIANGDWAGARGTLDRHAASIAASDRGLAYALAGDPVRAVEILSPASREPDATAKTRQNLALSMALAGRWQEAKSIAAIDVPPDQLDKRIMEWAAFSRPANAYDQVASLLGVRPIQDGGQPTQLALVQSSRAPALAEAAPLEEADPVDEYMPGTPANATQVASQMGVAMVPAAEERTQVETEIAGTDAQVVFGPREEVVQAIPTDYRARTQGPRLASRESTAPTPASTPSRAAKGKYYVQLGAYASAGVARDSWRRTAVKVPEVAQYSPQGSNVTTKAGNFYRLAVGGFARADADALCSTVKASGGNCFVRTGAGDQLASWARGDTQVAAR